MRSIFTFSAVRLLRLGLVAALAGSLGACGFKDPLRVEDPGVLTAEELTGVGAVEATVNGIIGAFQEAFDDYVRYTSLFTDEMILAGTFPTRVEVDDRRIVPSNVSLDGEVYAPIHTTRFLADQTVEDFSAAIGDPEFETVEDLLRVGTVVGRLYGAYARVLLAELYCESAIDAGPYELSDARMAEALTLFQEAEQAAADAAANVSTSARVARANNLGRAAIVGQARAHLWLGQWAEADADAARVPAGFVFNAEYSENDNPTCNEMHGSSWGRCLWVIRWTVGDGTTPERRNERFTYYDEWVALGRINPDPGPNFVSFNSAIPVRLQLQYTDGAVPIVLASKAEADMIQAEVALRNGQPGVANALVNPRRAAWGLGAIDFAAVGDLNGDATANTLADQLWQLAQERNRELWLTGERQATLRRYREEFGSDNAAGGLNLWPPMSGASFDQIFFPVHQQEFDNNPNTPNAQCRNFP